MSRSDDDAECERQEREEERRRPWRRPTIEIAWISPAALFCEGMPQPPLWHIRREVVDAAFAEAEREAAGADWKPAPSGAAVDLVPLWVLADEVARDEGGTPERHWVRLMVAFWRGEIAPGGLTMLIAAAPGIERYTMERDVLAAALLGLEPSTGKIAADVPRERELAGARETLARWRVADYRAAHLAHLFERDPEPDQPLGLAVERADFARWRVAQQQRSAAVAGVSAAAAGGKGRRRGDVSYPGDEALVERGVDLVKTKKAATARGAARLLIKQRPPEIGHQNPDTATERLRKKIKRRLAKMAI